MFEHRIHDTAKYVEAENIHSTAVGILALVEVGAIIHLELDDEEGSVYYGVVQTVAIGWLAVDVDGEIVVISINEFEGGFWDEDMQQTMLLMEKGWKIS